MKQSLENIYKFKLIRSLSINQYLLPTCLLPRVYVLIIFVLLLNNLDILLLLRRIAYLHPTECSLRKVYQKVENRHHIIPS